MHKISEVDEQARTGICSECGAVNLKRRGTASWRCRERENERRRKTGQRWAPSERPRVYRKAKGTSCKACGFTGHPCQLDVDHIDGNHANNALSNLQTLCANCHRLKTYNDKKTLRPRP